MKKVLKSSIAWNFLKIFNFLSDITHYTGSMNKGYRYGVTST